MCTAFKLQDLVGTTLMELPSRDCAAPAQVDAPLQSTVACSQEELLDEVAQADAARLTSDGGHVGGSNCHIEDRTP